MQQMGEAGSKCLCGDSLEQIQEGRLCILCTSLCSAVSNNNSHEESPVANSEGMCDFYSAAA
jgi:hypothetical protein